MTEVPSVHLVPYEGRSPSSTSAIQLYGEPASQLVKALTSAGGGLRRTRTVATTETYQLVYSDALARGIDKGIYKASNPSVGDVSAYVHNAKTGRRVGQGSLHRSGGAAVKVPVGPLLLEAASAAAQAQALAEMRQTLVSIETKVDETLERLTDEHRGTFSQAYADAHAGAEILARGERVTDARLEELRASARDAAQRCHVLRQTAQRAVRNYADGELSLEKAHAQLELLMAGVAVVASCGEVLVSQPQDDVHAARAIAETERDRVEPLLAGVSELTAQLIEASDGWAARGELWRKAQFRRGPLKRLPITKPQIERGERFGITTPRKPRQAPLDQSERERLGRANSIDRVAPRPLLAEFHPDGRVVIASEASASVA